MFEITVLTRQEEIDAQAWADQDSDGLSHVLKMDVARLSFAIKKIDGVEMDPYVRDPETGDNMQRNIFLRKELMGLPSPLLDALVNKYNIAKSKLREKLGMQQVSLETLFEQAMNVEKAAKEYAKEQAHMKDHELADLLVSEPDEELNVPL